jgi:hypothetical protein
VTRRLGSFHHALATARSPPHQAEDHSCSSTALRRLRAASRRAQRSRGNEDPLASKATSGVRQFRPHIPAGPCNHHPPARRPASAKSPTNSSRSFGDRCLHRLPEPPAPCASQRVLSPFGGPLGLPTLTRFKATGHLLNRRRLEVPPSLILPAAIGSPVQPTRLSSTHDLSPSSPR